MGEINVLSISWIHLVTMPLLLGSGLVVLAIFYALSRRLNRERDMQDVAWFNCYRATCFTLCLVIGVLISIWLVPGITVTPLQAEGYTIATGTMWVFEAQMFGLLAFGVYQWQVELGMHAWQRRRDEAT